MDANLLPKDGETRYFPGLFTADESDYFFNCLATEIPWKQDSIYLFGRKVNQPRLTAWYGDRGYSYSGITMTPLAWTDVLLQIKSRVEIVAKTAFNSALLNQYRCEKDSVGWHRDNETSLGSNPVIASASFGAMRTFRLRHYFEKNLKQSVDLTHGSLLLMRGETQHFWEHCVPKKTRPTGPRINITFRALAWTE